MTPTLLAFIVLLPVALIGAMLPFFGRTSRGVLFGVTVPLDFLSSPTARTALHRYRRDTLFLVLTIVFATALMLLTAHGRVLPIATSISTPLELLGAFILWRRGARAIKPYGIAVPLQRSASLFSMRIAIPMLAIAAAFLPLIADALWLRLHWASIPTRFPQHWNASGKIDGWGTRSVASVFGPLIVGAVLLLLFVATAYFMSKASGPQARLRRLALAPMAALAWLITGMFCLIGLLPLRQNISIHSILTISILHLLATFAIAFWLLWRGNMRQANTAAEPYDSTPDAAWHAGGLIYFNPADAAVLVPKRFGWGWTLNFARPVSWVYLFGVIFIALIARALPHLLK
jgi:uncharacterized membrane protein